MKIKYLIDTILTPKISVLDFVDRYAGIVRTINIAEGNGTETGIIKRYPLACDVTGVDCANVGVYQNLVPDDTKKSVVYWEMISPMSNMGMTKTRDFYRKKFKGTARLVVWLNLAKLGIDNCTDSILVLPILEKEITTKGKILGGVYAGDLLWIEPLRMVNQDINTIFGKYDYNKLKNYYLYPFDFFAIDVQFILEQCLSRGGAGLPCALPIDCPNDPLPVCKSILFDGVNEYIDCTNNSAFDLEYTDSFSFNSWVKYTGGPNRCISSKRQFLGVSSVSGWFFFVNSLGYLDLSISGGTSGNSLRESGNTTVPLITWCLATFTYDGSGTAAGVNFYINGIKEVNKTTQQDTFSGSILTVEPLKIAAETTQGYYFKGNISAAKMWKTELTETDVQNYYNCNINIPKKSDLILNSDIGNALWNGTEFLIPDLTGITAGYTSINSEEADLLTDCP